MGVLVVFHAHPDDEAIGTGGSIARAHAEGHRVVLVVATDGAHGQTPDDLAPGETLADRRRSETEQSAAVLGVDRLEWLGYTDSGMNGWEQNHDPASFHQAPLDEAADRLASLLATEAADVLVIYDWHGIYGHPDHVKVHRVGVRAAELVAARRPGLRVVDVTMNRDEMARHMREAAESGQLPLEEGFDPESGADDGNPFGTPESEITLAVDVMAWVGQKRRSIECHRSQIDDTGFFASFTDEQFARAFGTEWFVERDRGPGRRTGWLFES
jgi:LmbE family N-acetylglucosaminyl deacetylase